MDISITSACSTEKAAAWATCISGAFVTASGALDGNGVGVARVSGLGRGISTGVADGKIAVGEDEILPPSERVGETVDNLGASTFSVASSRIAVACLGDSTGVVDGTGGGVIKAAGPDVDDGERTGVEAGIAVGDGLGVEAVPHPSSPRMTTDVSAQVLSGHDMSRFYQTQDAWPGAEIIPASHSLMALTRCSQGNMRDSAAIGRITN